MQNYPPRIEEITVQEFKEKLDRGEDIQVIDVREPYEYEAANLPAAKLIPLGQILNRMGELDESRETVVHCKSGGRSAHAIAALQRAGYRGRLLNLKGGITAYAAEIDSSVVKH